MMSNFVKMQFMLLVFIVMFFNVQLLAAEEDGYSVTESVVIYDGNNVFTPSVVKAPNGDLICCYTDTFDVAPGGKVHFLKSTDEGMTWSSTPYLSLNSDYGAIGSVFGMLYTDEASGKIVLSVTDVNTNNDPNRKWAYTSSMYTYISTNNGTSFTRGSNIPTVTTDMEVISGGILKASNGDWLQPGYDMNRNDDTNYVQSGFYRSTNNGQTWGTLEVAFADGDPNGPDYKAFNEVDITLRKDGSLLAVARTDREIGYGEIGGQLYSCESIDNGQTWTTPHKLGIPGHCPSLHTMPNGTVLLGCRLLGPTGSNTSVFIFADGDVNSFEQLFGVNEPRPNGNSATGYPTFAQLDDPGQVYMAFYATDSNLPYNAPQTYGAGNLIEVPHPKVSTAFPYRYEADVLPSAVSSAYTYGTGTSTPENAVFSVSSGILKLDTNTPAPGGEGAWYTLAGGTGTVWNPPFAGPFTMEVRMKSYPNNSSTYNAWFQWFDGNSSILLQVWNNKVSLNGTTITGLDNQTDLHTFRIVSWQYGASADQRFDLYRDDIKIIDDAANVANFSSRSFQFGDMTGAGEVNVEIDYIRWDGNNGWVPATGSDSDYFAYKYEASGLPSVGSPAYTYSSTTQVESAYASVSEGILTLDTVTDGQDSDNGWYTLDGGFGTTWDPNSSGPYTMEIKMKSYPNNSSTYNAWFQWFDGNSSILLQVWHNKISLNGVEFTGLDNDNVFHAYRIVSEGYTSSAAQEFDLYRDDELIIDDACNVVNFSSRSFQFGDMTGSEESKVAVDYICWDEKLDWAPIPHKDSSEFNYKYEASGLPSAGSPAYTYSSTTQVESAYASFSDGILALDTVTDGQDSDNGWYTLDGGTGTVWNPSSSGPYTMEIKMKSYPNNSSTYNAWFQWFDGNSSILLQVWHNKISLNDVEVTGLDNDDVFHVYRIVSEGYTSSAAQKFDLYRDDELIIDDAGNVVNYSNRAFKFGDMTGSAESKVAVDYIRWDDDDIWLPVL